MAKPTTGDSITIAIISATAIAVIYLLLQSGIFAPSNNIVILDTDPLIEAIQAGENDHDLLEVRRQINATAESLAEQGFIVLRSEMVRAAPRELYVQVQE